METNRQHVFTTLELLTAGLFPYVEQGLKKVYGDKWHEEALASFRDDHKINAPTKTVIKWDAHNLLTVMWDQWNRIFRQDMRQTERSLVAELREFRNRWAHQETFDFDDTYRVLDSAERLLDAAGATQAGELQRMKEDLMRERVARDVRQAYRKTKIRKKKIKDISVYCVCCVISIALVLYTFKWEAWFFPIFAIGFFGYLTYDRLKTPTPLFHGPHECHNCGKIVYTEECPYCETAPEMDTLNISDSQRIEIVGSDNQQTVTKPR